MIKQTLVKGSDKVKVNFVLPKDSAAGKVSVVGDTTAGTRSPTRSVRAATAPRASPSPSQSRSGSPSATSTTTAAGSTTMPPTSTWTTASAASTAWCTPRPSEPRGSSVLAQTFLRAAAISPTVASTLAASTSRGMRLSSVPAAA